MKTRTDTLENRSSPALIRQPRNPLCQESWGQVPRVTGRRQDPGRALLECLRDRQGDVLRFVHDLRIPPTSNQAERDVRPAKTQEKISGQLRSEQATRQRYAIRGYISTAATHGENMLTVLRDAITGKPWMPPIPDPP